MTCGVAPETFEALPWVQDAFANGIKLAYLPVYEAAHHNEYDQLASLKMFSATNYTISAEVSLFCPRLERISTLI